MYTSAMNPGDYFLSGEAEWQTIVVRFTALIEELAALAQSDPELLNHEVKAMHPVHNQQSFSVLAVLWQTAVHNSYHVGQIVVLRRLLNLWTEQAGDTW
jgi:hypothetical protein